ncbi:MAG: radical SAM protein [Candidatus Omnitrophica bacterium]|nr:radical SAM protein [Candidatus Omnitrophota bacterium]
MSIYTKRFFYLLKRNALFYLSRKLDYPLTHPDTLQINFTFRCNLRCRMCSMHERIQELKSQNRPIELGIDTIKKVIREGALLGIRSLILIGGEPFLEPRLHELVAEAHRQRMGVTVVTNGTLISAEAIEQMFAAGLDNLSISIDAATEAGFAAIRGEKAFGRILDNIKLLSRMKEEHKRSIPSVVSVCTIMNQNVAELLDIVLLCRSLGIAKLIFQPVVRDNTDQTRVDFNSSVFIPPSRFAELDAMLDRLIAYKLQSPEDFNFIANSTRHLELMKRYFRGTLKPRFLPCYAGFNRVQIVQEGKLYFCVNQNKYEATFGDVSADSLRDLWFSRKARACRKLIRRCTVPCLQWCAYRDEFIELSEMLQQERLFGGKKKGSL